MNHQFKNKVVVVTGGSSGIGLAIAKRFLYLGAIVIIIGRDKLKLKKISSELAKEYNEESISYVIADVSDPIQIKRCIDEIAIKYLAINILINNAGIMECGRFDEMTLEDIDKVHSTNYMGALYTTKAAWKYLEKTQGRIGFVSSIAGYMGLIGYTAYTPSKFALTGFAECLRMEGKNAGIRISVVFPGDIDTPMLEYEQSRALKETKKLNKNIKPRKPELVARKLIYALENGKFEVFCDSSAFWLRFFKNMFPKLFYFTIDKMAFH